MNGWIYSPKLGRMLSPDPVTQAPENGQNYDRYTYAFNNPLKYIDPTGYSNELGEGNTGLFPDSQLIQHTWSWDDFHLDHNDPAQVLYWPLHSGALGPDSSAYQVVQASQGISVGGAVSGGGASSSDGSLSLGAPPGFEDYSVPTPIFEGPSLPPAPPVPVRDSADDVDGGGDPTGGNGCSDPGSACSIAILSNAGMINVVTTLYVGANYDPRRDPNYVRLFQNASIGRIPVVGPHSTGEAARQATDVLLYEAELIGCLAVGATLCTYWGLGRGTVKAYQTEHPLDVFELGYEVYRWRFGGGHVINQGADLFISEILGALPRE